MKQQTPEFQSDFDDAGYLEAIERRQAEEDARLAEEDARVSELYRRELSPENIGKLTFSSFEAGAATEGASDAVHHIDVRDDSAGETAIDIRN